MRRRKFITTVGAVAAGGCIGNPSKSESSDESGKGEFETRSPTQTKVDITPIDVHTQKPASNRAATPTPQGDPEIEIETPDLSTIETVNGEKYYAYPEMTNVGDAPAGHVLIRVNWFDKSGDIYHTTTRSLSKLEAGETWMPYIASVPQKASTETYEIRLDGTGNAPSSPSSIYVSRSELKTKIHSNLTGVVDKVEVEAQIENEYDGTIYAEAFAKLYDKQGRVMTDKQAIGSSFSTGETWTPTYRFPVLAREEHVSSHELILDIMTAD